MAKSIHDALWKWFAGCASIAQLFFNFSSTDDGDTAIATSGDTLLEDYIDGSQRRRYAFELIRFLPVSVAANDDSNVAMMDDVESIIEWVRRQSDDGAFPDFPAGYTVESVGVLEESVGYVAAQDENTAKYMIPFAVDYVKG